MWCATNDLVPVAKTQDPREKEVTGARKEIQRSENPAKVTQIGSIVSIPRGHQSDCACKKVDESSTRVDPTVRMQG